MCASHKVNKIVSVSRSETIPNEWSVVHIQWKVVSDDQIQYITHIQ